MCTTVLADDVTFEDDPGIGAYRVQVMQRGAVEVEVIISQATLQKAIARAMGVIAERSSRPVNVVAFGK